MTVHVRAVFKNGELGKIYGAGCFGFMHDCSGTAAVLGCYKETKYAGLENVQKIMYHIPANLFVAPKDGNKTRRGLHPQEEIVVRKYYDILHSMGITRFIQEDKVTLEQVNDPKRGITLDITKYPGQFIVGIFEMFRNATYHYSYVKKVVELADKGMSPAAAFCVARIMPNINGPYADVLPNHVLYARMANFLTDTALQVGFKLYPLPLLEGSGYAGVFKLFAAFCRDDILHHSVLSAITKKGNIGINRAIPMYSYGRFLEREGDSRNIKPGMYTKYNEYFQKNNEELPESIIKQLENFVLYGTEVKI